MERPVVVVFTPLYPPRKGGSSTYFSTLVSLLKDRVDFTVVTLQTDGTQAEEKKDGVRIIRCLPERFSSGSMKRYKDVIPRTFKILNRLRKEGDYILHIHSNGIYGYSASIFSSLHNIPLIKEVQDTSDRGFVLKAGNVKRWISVGDFVKERLISFGIPSDRIIKFPSMNPPELEDLARRSSASKRKEGGPIRILFVGWLVNRIKGADILVKAFRRAFRENGNLELIIVGEGPDRKGLEEISKDLPVSFMGELDYPELIELVAGSDILALTSHEEANPRVILEAYRMSVPVIATEVGGVPEEVTDGVTGLLVKDGDIDALANSILRLASDQEMRERMGASGRKFLKGLPSWEELSETVFDLYLEYSGLEP
jgi:glycosyltransferase involved in cell wall biosynthesis